MNIQHEKNSKGGKFFIEKDGKEIALMTYRENQPDVMLIDHTEVDRSMREQGIGGSLVKASVEYARKNSKKIIPQCPFAEAEFEENDAYADVLA